MIQQTSIPVLFQRSDGGAKGAYGSLRAEFLPLGYIYLSSTVFAIVPNFDDTAHIHIHL